MKNKRLFLFAGYDKDGIIDDTLVYYLDALSKLGDIVLVMDCEVKDVSKLKNIKNLLHFETLHHGEYDFGSYKRGFMWAFEKKILNKYDWLYLVNDSVYGPLFDVEPCLKELESRKADLIGLVDFFDKYTPKHVQSWFVGMSKKIATSSILYDFMQSIKQRKNKSEIVCKYEVGLSRMLLQNGFKMSTLFTQDGHDNHPVYDTPKTILENFIPFVKKQGLKNIGGNVYLLPYTTDYFNDIVFAHAERTGLDYPKKDIEQQKNRIYRLTFLSIPICTIYQEEFFYSKFFRVYLFDKIKIIKINRKK